MNSHSSTSTLILGSSRLIRLEKGESPSLARSTERRSLFKSLNEALAAELICVLRRHARQRSAPGSGGMEKTVATGFQFWTDFELANRMAERIAQLGGRPDLALESLGAKDHLEPEAPLPTDERIAADLAAERAAANLHSKLLVRLRISDPGTSVLLCELLVEGEEQLRILSESKP